jgi:hypothetical protein
MQHAKTQPPPPPRSWRAPDAESVATCYLAMSVFAICPIPSPQHQHPGGSLSLASRGGWSAVHRGAVWGGPDQGPPALFLGLGAWGLVSSIETGAYSGPRLSAIVVATATEIP